MASKSDLVITDLSGGLNDTNPPTSLAANQCVEVENVEFWQAPCGARRNGCEPITLPSSLSTKAAITFLHRHLPTGDETAAQLWTLGTTIASAIQLAYKDTAWHDVSFVDAPTNTGVYPYQFNAQSLHGKLFLAYKSGVDRLHVWDGTTLRRAGLKRPTAAPTGANDGGVGTFSGTRYYRIRYTVQSGGTTLRRSEPSDVLTFSPNGNDTGIVVTKPASISESETHWELEASLDNANFYIIATTVVGTTTATDTTSAATGYGAFVLSEDVGDYETIPSGRFLIADQDRLIIGGSFENDINASAVRWTPVYNDPGDGNDERIPIDTDNLLNLDGFEGGGLTAMANPVNGLIFAFKWSHIYKLVRTGQREQAYEPVVVTKQRGALPGSVIEGYDGTGSPCLYFLDPKVGPCRLGAGGLLWAGSDIYETWKTVNINATTVVSRVVYYPDKQQVHWWLATEDANTPDLRIVLQTNDTRVTESGVQFGWARHSGISTQAVAACLFATNIEDNAARSLSLKPLIAIGNEVHMLDTGDMDDGTPYVSRLVSAPRLVSGTPLQRFGIRAASVIGEANDDAVVSVGLIKNFGVETQAVDVDMAPDATEDPVIKDVDNLALSELKAVQIVLTDGTDNAGQWAIHRLDFRPRGEEGA